MKVEIGDATLYLGDCMDILPTLDKVDAVITDPPYEVITGGCTKDNDENRPTGILKSNSQLMDSTPDFSLWIPKVYEVLKEQSHVYLMSNFFNLHEMWEESIDAGFKAHNLLVWKKNTNTPSQFYMKNCEYTLFLRKGKAKFINDMGGSKTVHDFDNTVNRLHPTQKPVELMSFYTNNSTNIGDVLLDPFMGSGTTGVAAIKMGRKFIGIEREPKYFDIACKRIEQASKQVDMFIEQPKQEQVSLL